MKPIGIFLSWSCEMSGKCMTSTKLCASRSSTSERCLFLWNWNSLSLSSFEWFLRNFSNAKSGIVMDETALDFRMQFPFSSSNSETVSSKDVFEEVLNIFIRGLQSFRKSSNSLIKEWSVSFSARKKLRLFSGFLPMELDETADKPGAIKIVLLKLTSLVLG